MHREPSILILTASYGEGHVQAARALHQQFVSQGYKHVEVVDLIKNAYPVIHSIASKIYLRSPNSARLGLDYYGWGYAATKNSDADATWKKYLDEIGKKELVRTIRKCRPDVIINTFPFAAASAIGKRFDIPVYTVVTDYVMHSLWMHPDTSHYFVASDQLKHECVTHAVKPDHVTVSGIPVRKAFEQLQTAVTDNQYAKLFSQNKDILLIVAGSYGVLGKISSMVRGLIGQGQMEIVVVCGRNEKLKRKLSAQFASQPTVHIFGFVENIHELMSIASCIVTKAGGITLTESLLTKLPILIFKPFAGQESGNAHFFQANGAALIAHSPKELQHQIINLLSDRDRLLYMKQAMGKMNHGSAAQTIVDRIAGFGFTRWNKIQSSGS